MYIFKWTTLTLFVVFPGTLHLMSLKLYCPIGSDGSCSLFVASANVLNNNHSNMPKTMELSSGFWNPSFVLLQSLLYCHRIN